MLVFASLAIGSCALEAVGRIISPRAKLFELENYRKHQTSLLRSAYPASYDPTLGWTPTPSFRSTANIWHTRITIDAGGLRSNGPNARTSSSGAILAVGDSYTFGDEVSDDETYPAALEQKTSRRVYNGGVFGYGIDQTVLRAETLAAKLRPAVVVVGFIPEDIDRVRLRVRAGVAKPYFVPAGDDLALENVPVPPDRPDAQDLGLVRDVFGYSFLVEWTMQRIAPAWWTLGQWPSATVDVDANLVSCRLMKRLRDRITRPTRTVVLLQYGRAEYEAADGPARKQALTVLECAKGAGLDVLDTFDGAGPKLLALTAPTSHGHMTAEGNAIIAETVADHLAGLGL
jgi:hypothetical protein